VSDLYKKCLYLYQHLKSKLYESIKIILFVVVILVSVPLIAALFVKKDYKLQGRTGGSGK
jgi:hypothetical protein